MASTLPNNSVDICPDNHQCENNGSCVENPEAEGKYYCDCGALNDARAFAGLYCQHEATEYCTETGEVSHISFCTNEGTCKGKVADGTDTHHLGCDCQPGYTGPHCQFVEGSVPEGYPIQNGSWLNSNNAAFSANDASNIAVGSDNDDADMGIIVGVSVALAVGLSVIVAVLTVIYRRRRLHNSTHVVDKTKSTDGNLHEAYGESLENVRTETFETCDHVDDELQASESGEIA